MAGRGRTSAAEITEARIVRAAETVFARKGYFDATVEDIVYRAKVSRGTFYLYFKNKDDVFRRVVSAVIDALFRVSAAQSKGTLRERVELGNRRFLQAFQENRDLMRALFQVETVLPEIAALHNDLRRRFIERIKRHLDKGIGRGICYPQDTRVTSFALGMMIETVAYSRLSVGFEPFGEGVTMEQLVQELTNLWCRAAYRDGQGNLVPDP